MSQPCAYSVSALAQRDTFERTSRWKLHEKGWLQIYADAAQESCAQPLETLLIALPIRGWSSVAQAGSKNAKIPVFKMMLIMAIPWFRILSRNKSGRGSKAFLLFIRPFLFTLSGWLQCCQETPMNCWNSMSSDYCRLLRDWCCTLENFKFLISRPWGWAGNMRYSKKWTGPQLASPSRILTYRAWKAWKDSSWFAVAAVESFDGSNSWKRVPSLWAKWQGYKVSQHMAYHVMHLQLTNKRLTRGTTPFHPIRQQH